LDGNNINYLNSKDLDLLQSLQDEAATENDLYIQLLYPNFSPITNHSFPQNTNFAGLSDKDLLLDFLFTIEGNLTIFCTYISEPLFSTYLTGKIIRSLIPVRLDQNTLAYINVVKISDNQSINQIIAQSTLQPVPSQISPLENLLDNYAIIPPNNFVDQVEKLEEQMVLFVIEKLNNAIPSGENKKVRNQNFPNIQNSLIFYTNMQGQIVHTSESLLLLLGYENKKDLKGESIYNILKIHSSDTIPRSPGDPALEEKYLHGVELTHQNGPTLFANLHINNYFSENCKSTPTMMQWEIEPITPELSPLPEGPHDLPEIPQLFPIEADTVFKSPSTLSETTTVADNKNKISDDHFPFVQSLQGFVSVLNTYPRPLFILDKNNGIKLWNKRAEQLFLFKPDEKIFNNFDDFLTDESKPIWDRELNVFRNNKSTTDLLLDQFLKCNSAEGDLISAKFDLFKNEILGTDFISVTVQEIEKSIPGNEYLLSQASKTTGGIILTDNGGDILSANKNALLFLNMEKAELEKINASDMFIRKDRHLLNNIILKLYIKNSFDTKACLTEKFKIDNPVNISIHKLLKNKDDHYNLIWIINSDEIEDENKIAGSETDKISNEGTESPSESLADIYNIFSGLFEKISFKIFETLAELHEEMNANPAQQDLLVRIEDVADQASKVGEKLKIFKYKGQPALKPFDLNLLLEDLLKILCTEFHHQVILDKKNIVPILADQEDLWFIFHALLENADEAIQEKGEIVVRTFLKTAKSLDHIFDPSDFDTKFVACQISDNGKGIPTSIQKKLFTLFGSDKIDRLGRGMSLACVRAIVNRYNGYIDVKTGPDQGTCITVYFPTLPPKASKAKTGIQLNPALSTILAVDDDKLILEMYSTNLENEYNVLCAENGEEAISLMDEYQKEIQLCIADLNLPDKKMIDCPMALHEKKPTIPFIIATGYSNDGSLDDLLKKVRTFWLHKPFPVQKLKIAIDKILNIY
jgi:nitrogen-specific signal transduction histidine kinase/CheY-like chemotaxis protein